MKLDDALVVIFVLLATALAALAIFTIVVDPDRAQAMTAMAGILAGVLAGILALMRQRKSGDDGDPDG